MQIIYDQLNGNKDCRPTKEISLCASQKIVDAATGCIRSIHNCQVLAWQRELGMLEEFFYGYLNGVIPHRFLKSQRLNLDSDILKIEKLKAGNIYRHFNMHPIGQLLQAEMTAPGADIKIVPQRDRDNFPPLPNSAAPLTDFFQSTTSIQSSSTSPSAPSGTKPAT